MRALIVAATIAACTPAMADMGLPFETGQYVDGGRASPAQVRQMGAGSTIRASWYGGGEKLSKYTASGERFVPALKTAAHRSYPFGTMLHVTNPRNGVSVVVRVNDRGPASWTGNSLDLSRGAAQAIGMRSTQPVVVARIN